MDNGPVSEGSCRVGILKRADSGRLREEADYPPSFCVQDQDQQANPPLAEESRVRGRQGR